MSKELSDSREAFEKYWADNYTGPLMVDDYPSTEAQICWLGWQAAIAHKSEGVKVRLTQDVLDHCWEMYQQGQISADHTAKQVFEGTLLSLAVWLAKHNLVAVSCKACDGYGSIWTGIDEAPADLCKSCSGTGTAPAAPVAVPVDASIPPIMYNGDTKRDPALKALLNAQIADRLSMTTGQVKQLDAVLDRIFDGPVIVPAAAPSYSKQIKWPEGYCLDPNGAMTCPAGMHEAWSFGYDLGYADALIAKAPQVASSTDDYAATRLRGICKTLGLESAIPADDAELLDSLFSVLGQIRFQIERMQASAPVPHSGEAAPVGTAGPEGGALVQFSKWYAAQDFSGMPAKEISSLSFDAGHLFWHEKNLSEDWIETAKSLARNWRLSRRGAESQQAFARFENHLKTHGAPIGEAGGVVAHVPIHPTQGPLWANTVPLLDVGDRPKHYPTLPLYFAAQPQAAPSTDTRHVGDSRFEGWYSDYRAHGASPKQIARDAYAAGMGDQTAAPSGLSDAVRDVLAERVRQVNVEGWTVEHDDEHTNGEMAKAAAAYALNAGNIAIGWPNDPMRAFCEPPPWWPWSREWWKPDTLRWMLIKAGALILAEIERIDRIAAASATGSGA